MLSETKRTEPSARAALTPPVCRLRAVAQVKPSARFCVQARGLNCPPGSVAGMRVSQPMRLSATGALGGYLAVKALPPAPGTSTQPRQSLLRPAGEVLETGSRASSKVRISLNIRVLDRPSLTAVSRVPLPRP